MIMWPIPLLDGAFFLNQHLILHILLEINIKPILECLKNGKKNNSFYISTFTNFIAGEMKDLIINELPSIK